MTNVSRWILSVIVLLTFLAAPFSALAQDDSGASAAASPKSDWDVVLGAGALLSPTFEGSDRYHVMPVPLVSITYKDTISLSGNGLNAYWRTGDLRIGAGLTYDGGRSDSQDDGLWASGDDRLRGMGDIDPAAGLKAFASYRLWRMDWRASVTKYVGTDNEGLVCDLDLAVPLNLSDKFSLTPHLGAVWANEDYMQTYFGVTSTQAERSGFSMFDADAGFKDIRAGLDVNYRLDEHWFINTRGEVKRLVGDAADSPISFSNTGASVSTMIGYRF